MTVRFQRWLSSPTCSNGHPSHLEEILDLCIKSLADPHHKVTAQAHIAIENLCKIRNTLLISRLDTLLPALFTRMCECHPGSREKASDMVDLIREVQDPQTIMAALSPRLTELPKRTLTSALQLLVALVPACESYFSQPQNTGAFIHKLAMVLSPSNGERPSPSAVVAGEQLLELVHKINSEVIIYFVTITLFSHSNGCSLSGHSLPPFLYTSRVASERC